MHHRNFFSPKSSSISLICLDIESNGFKGTSVLSVSAIKSNYKDGDFKETGTFNRFYYCHPEESKNAHAEKIHGLTDEVLNELRKETNYPSFFQQDTTAFLDFCRNADVFFAHNADFDSSFLPQLPREKFFCTMRANIRQFGGKWPSLSKLANFYGIHVSEKKLHASAYDTRLLYEIVKKMVFTGHCGILEKLNQFR